MRENPCGVLKGEVLGVLWLQWFHVLLSEILLCFYLKVQDYLRRFESIPDMLELDHLTVSGDVTFGKNVSLKVGIIKVMFIMAL